jgi:sugar phosphate isomerase/epimerase
LLGLNFEEALQGVREAGFTAIEIACREPHVSLEGIKKAPEAYAKLVERAGLSVAALSLYNTFTDSARLDDEIDAAAAFIRAASAFETRIVKLTPGPPASAEATDEHWRRLGRAMDELAPVAKEAGVQLAFETHMRQLSDTLASSKRLLELASSDVVGLTVDFSNLAFAGEDTRAVFSELGEHMAHAHVKNGSIDEDGGWHFQRLDEGLTNYDLVLKLLRDSGFDGYLSIECLDPEAQDDPVGVARRDLEILNKYLSRMEEEA